MENFRTFYEEVFLSPGADESPTRDVEDNEVPVPKAPAPVMKNGEVKRKELRLAKHRVRVSLLKDNESFWVVVKSLNDPNIGGKIPYSSAEDAAIGFGNISSRRLKSTADFLRFNSMKFPTAFSLSKMASDELIAVKKLMAPPEKDKEDKAGSDEAPPEEVQPDEVPPEEESEPASSADGDGQEPPAEETPEEPPPEGTDEET